LGGEPVLNQLKITVAQNAMDKEAIRATAYQLQNWLEAQGRPVYRIEIPDPGQHPHATQMATLLFLLEAFGFLALALSGVLTANMISALLAGQIRQIGVMKAVGANMRQISSLYFGLVLLLGLGGLVLGLPLALLAGCGYASFAADMLNFQILDDTIPVGYLALQVGLGLAVPLLAAAWPIVRGGRTTVRQAIGDYGIADASLKGAGLLKLPAGIAGRPFLLSLRNTFRKRGRLLLTLITLAFGGAGFIVATNVSASMDSTVNAKFDATRYDVQIGFSQPYAVETVEAVVRAVPGVTDVESWGGAQGAMLYADGTQSNTFKLIAPPASSRLMTALPLLEGRWLRAGDENALVVNQALLAKEPSLVAGSTVTLRIDGRDADWHVVGVVQEIMAPPLAYTTNEYLSQLAGLEGYASNVVVVAGQRDPESVAAVTRQLEAGLAAAEIDVTSAVRMPDYRQLIEDHLLLLASFLVIMSVLVLIIGGLGLISTMSINVLERTREIGVLRAIGASSPALLKIIVTEGAIVGAISWLLAALLSWPLSRYISTTFGLIFFEAPLRFAVSVAGMTLWLLVAIGFAALASFYPAWNASKLTVRQTLAYE
jgi:putative ABC transport system permease protein